MEKLKRGSLAAIFTLSGTTIGAGILGLPYVFSKSGFVAGLFWILFLGGIVIYLNLCMGEVSLRTKGRHHFVGFAEKYLGKTGKNIMLFAIFFEIYSALLAYLIGEGESLSRLFTGNAEFSILFGIGFWVIVSSMLYGGIKRLKKVEFWGVLILLSLILIIFVMLSPGVNFGNIIYSSPASLFLPFGVVLFALLGFTAVPDIQEEIPKNKKFVRTAIIVGTLIPIVAYILFSFVFVGNLGVSVNQIATTSFNGFIGKLLILLGVFTMLTSFFVLSFVLREISTKDLREKGKTFIIVSLIPLIIYVIFTLFNFTGFAGVLGIGGAVSGGVLAILILLMNIKSKRKGDRKPEFKVPINWIAIGILSLIFVAGMVVQILNSFG